MNYLKDLNPEQLKVVNATEGPLLVLAGPGTGKTQLLSIRTANIIERKKAAPENILILSYTNAAAKSVKERIVSIVSHRGYDVLTATFHSFANSIILESREAANYIQEKIQITDIERVKALEYILDNTKGIDAIRPFRAPYIYRPEIEQRLSELKKEGVTPAEFEVYIESLKPDEYIEEKHILRLKALAIVYKLYEEYKNGKNKDLFDERGRYDFDDMIIFALQAVKKEAELRRTLLQQYRYIMVDEYQDTNGAQLNLLFELLDPDKPNICCVGDDDQAIFRFQGASIGNFRILRERFPDIKVITLKNNYRSTNEIISLSDKIIRHLPDSERVDVKKLVPKKDYRRKTIEFHKFSAEAEELLFVVEKIKEIASQIEQDGELPSDIRKAPYNNIAVLVRKRDRIPKIIDLFVKAGIPYATDGKEDITSQKRVRQMIDVLSLAHLKDTTDISDKDAVLYRVISSDYFEISFNDILRFIGYVRAKRKARRYEDGIAEVTLFSEFLNAFKIKDKSLPPSIAETDSLAINEKIKFENPYAMHRASWVIKRLLADAEARPVHDILLEYIKDAGVYKYILRTYIDNEVIRIRDLRALSSFVNMVKEEDVSNPAIGLGDFIDEMETKKEHKISIAGELVTMTQDGVRVFTAHSSKGMEFHTVMLPFCLQDKDWPLKPQGDSILLPREIFKSREKITDKAFLRTLDFYDETRLFYVASTRAKSNLIYTASPTENAILSSYISTDVIARRPSLPKAGMADEAISRPKMGADEEDTLLKSLQLTDKGDPFIGSESVLKDILSNLTLSPTSLSNYIKCKRKFFYNNVLILPSQKRLALVFGNCVHKALEMTYRHLIEYALFPDFGFFKKAFERELHYQGVEKSIRSGCLRQLETLGAWFKRESLAPVTPIGLEKKLAVTLGNDLIFTGNYDKTEVVDKNKKLVRVIDYKTGVPDEHIKKIAVSSNDLSSDECEDYLRQLIAYKLLFDRDKSQNSGYKVSEGVLVFVEPIKSTVIKYGLQKGEFINKTIRISDDMVGELEGVIREVWKNIRALKFDKLPERDEKKCRVCDFDDICWGQGQP